MGLWGYIDVGSEIYGEIFLNKITFCGVQLLYGTAQLLNVSLNVEQTDRWSAMLRQNECMMLSSVRANTYAFFDFQIAIC